MKNRLKNLLISVVLVTAFSFLLIGGSRMLAKDEAEKSQVKMAPHTITLYSSGTKVGEWKEAKNLYFSADGRMDFTDQEGRRVSIRGEFVVVPEKTQVTSNSLPGIR